MFEQQNFSGQPISNSGKNRHVKTVLLLIGLMWTMILSAEAQQPKKVPQIGYVFNTSHSAAAFRVEAFRQGLRELKYVEGKNIVIESRYSGKTRSLARARGRTRPPQGGGHRHEWSDGNPCCQEATKTIPVVFARDANPIARGFVASLARPGGNITGLSTFGPELNGK